MQAAIIRAYGDNGVVEFVDVPKPVPQAGQVLVKVHAAGINPVDWKIRNGAGQRMGLTLPISLGSEIAGTIEATGEGVTQFAVGDAVYGIVGAGAFAECVLAPDAHLALKPANLDFVAAAAVPLGALTAWQAMFDVAGVHAGQRLLITGGSGGVGSLAVQIAKAKGIHVTAMASTRNEAFVRELGVDSFVDYTAQPFEQVVSDMDVVFDTVGGDTFARAGATLKPGGFLVTSVAFPKDEAERFGVKVARVQCKANAAQLEQIRALVEDGQLVPHVAEVFALDAFRQALHVSEEGHVRGKLVLRVG